MGRDDLLVKSQGSQFCGVFFLNSHVVRSHLNTFRHMSFRKKKRVDCFEVRDFLKKEQM